MNLLPALEVQGSRINTLAERSGMTKQAAGQLVTELEMHGYVARGPDPTDGRASLITFTEAGWQFLLDAQQLKRELEAEYRAQLGPALWEALHEALRRLAAAETNAD